MADRTLTDADITALVQAFRADHACRYSVDPSELAEAVRFFKNVNAALEDTRKTVRTTILVFFLAGILGLVGLGFWSKVRVG